ncbi:hypothetical protein ABIA38_005520 [Embleya sp. AB8]
MGVGAFVVHRGRTWQVVAVQGQRVHLLQEDGQETTLPVGRLFADPGFEVAQGRTGRPLVGTTVTDAPRTTVTRSPGVPPDVRTRLVWHVRA